MSIFLLDSVLLIDYLQGVKPSVEWFTALEKESAAISVISIAEVLTGCENPQELAAAKRLFSHFRCLKTRISTAIQAAALRQEFNWKLPDAFQAALAQQYRLLFATRNTRDFPPEKFPFVRIPYNLPNY